jgi:hypothetical protein
MNVEIPQFPELTFDERSHIYRLDGLVVPSVTTIMQPLSRAHYGGIDQDVLERAAERGTAVHQAIENLICFDILDISPEYEGYLEAYRAWVKDYNVKPFASEMKTYHKTLRYAGTADLGCEENGVNTLVDFKTTSSLVPMLVGVQLEAYRRAQESHGIKYENTVALQLRSDGTYRRITGSALPPKAECWKVFGSLLNVAGFIEKYK